MLSTDAKFFFAHIGQWAILSLKIGCINTWKITCYFKSPTSKAIYVFTFFLMMNKKFHLWIIIIKVYKASAHRGGYVPNSFIGY